MMARYLWSFSRAKLAKAIYPEGFYNDDASREIDRLTVALEEARKRIRELGGE